MNAQELQEVYLCLEQKQLEILRSLHHRSFEVEYGWYNGHYHKDENGSWIRESYPIPVIEIKGLCDVEIQFDKISVSTKLKRDAALAYSFEPFIGYEFEAYGVKDYLTDFYQVGATVQKMKECICVSDETEIGFSFLFPFGIDEIKIFEFTNLLQGEGFFY